MDKERHQAALKQTTEDKAKHDMNNHTKKRPKVTIKRKISSQLEEVESKKQSSYVVPHTGMELDIVIKDKEEATKRSISYAGAAKEYHLSS